MNWTNLGDILFLAGGLLAAGFIVYGVWLSITAPEVDRRRARGGGRTRDATPEAEPFPSGPCDAAPRESLGATLKAAMTGGTWIGILILLFLTSAGYVVFGGAYEVGSAPKAETSIAAAEPADVGGALREENLSAGSGTEKR